jgi:hypothetical protein
VEARQGRRDILASGIIPATFFARSEPRGLFRAPYLRIPGLRNYPSHLICAFLLSGIIPAILFAHSCSP